MQSSQNAGPATPDRTPQRPARPRAFLLQNGLRAASSHFLQETEGWIHNLQLAGYDPSVHGNVEYAGGPVAGLEIQASFRVAPDSLADGPEPVRKLRTFLEGAAIFTADCRKLEAENPGPGDLVLVPYATSVEIMGLSRWLERWKQRGPGLPQVGVLVHRPDYDWSWDRSTGVLRGDVAPFAYACFSLSLVCGGQRLALAATTPALAQALGQYLEQPFIAGCAPLHYPPLPDQPAEPRWDFAFLGQMRPEKGSRSLAAIVQAYLAERPGGRIAIQCDSPGEPGQYLDGHAAIAHDPRIDWLMGPQDGATFQNTLQQAACILIPSEPSRYQLRISGVFSEALGGGRPVVVAGPSWMTDMLQAGHGAGVAVRHGTPENFARALLMIGQSLPEFQQRARERSVRWRNEQSLERLIAIIEARVAAG